MASNEIFSQLGFWMGSFCLQHLLLLIYPLFTCAVNTDLDIKSSCPWRRIWFGSGSTTLVSTVIPNAWYIVTSYFLKADFICSDEIIRVQITGFYRTVPYRYMQYCMQWHTGTKDFIGGGIGGEPRLELDSDLVSGAYPNRNTFSKLSMFV